VSDLNIRNAIVVSDTHCGDRLGLCPAEGVALDDGGWFTPDPIVKKMWKMWLSFWSDWVPEVTRGEPFCVIHNGDAINGKPHQTIGNITDDLEDQVQIAYDILKPVVELCEGRYYHIRGTEAHIGKGGSDEERLAKRLGAIPNEIGQHARKDLWLELGKGLVHVMHHIGSTSSSAYEATAVFKEWNEEVVEAGRWGLRRPDVVVRSHRHRCIETRAPTANGYGISVVTPCWQLANMYCFRHAGARVTTPQIGGIAICDGEHDGLYTRTKVWKIERSPAERPPNGTAKDTVRRVDSRPRKSNRRK